MTENKSQITKIIFDVADDPDEGGISAVDPSEVGNLTIMFGESAITFEMDANLSEPVLLGDNDGVARVVGQTAGEFTILVSKEGAADNPDVVLTIIDESNGAKEINSVSYSLMGRRADEKMRTKPIFDMVMEDHPAAEMGAQDVLLVSQALNEDDMYLDTAKQVGRDSLRDILSGVIDADDDFLDFLDNHLGEAFFVETMLLGMKDLGAAIYLEP